MIQGVLIDLSGVLYVGDKALPGAAAAMARLRASGLPARFVTNTTRTPRNRLIRRLASFGFDLSAKDLFTPAIAARQILADRNLAAHFLIHPALAEDFDRLDAAGTSGRAVVIGDAGDGFTYESLNAAFRELADGAAFLALAKNRVFKDEDGKLSLDAGAFVAALEYAAGQSAVVLGKPSLDFYAAAAASMNLPLSDLVMIGDDLESDVSGALLAGVGKALLVRTGKYIEGAEAAADPAPSAVVDDFAAAIDWILSRNS